MTKAPHVRDKGPVGNSSVKGGKAELVSVVEVCTDCEMTSRAHACTCNLCGCPREERARREQALALEQIRTRERVLKEDFIAIMQV